MDFRSLKKLTIGGVELKQLFINGVQVWKSGYKNWVKYSTEADGVTIYNGVGYKNGYRVRSGGAEQATSNASCIGFIPVKGEDVVRISGCDFDYASNSNSINVSDSSFTNIGQFTMLTDGSVYGIFGSNYLAYNRKSVVKEKDGVWKWIVPPAASGVAYIRVTGYKYGCPGADMIVTINEEIT